MRHGSKPKGFYTSLLTLQKRRWARGALVITHLPLDSSLQLLPRSFPWGKASLSPHEDDLDKLFFFFTSKLLAVKGKQSAGSVCRHGLRKSPSPPPAGSTHTSAAWETTNTRLVISSVLPAAEGLHKKNPWTSDYFLEHLSSQTFQQTDAGLVLVRSVECCFLACPATFPTIINPARSRRSPHQHVTHLLSDTDWIFEVHCLCCSCMDTGQKLRLSWVFCN